MSPRPLSLPVQLVLLGWAGFWSFFILLMEMAQADPLPTKAVICFGGMLFFLGSAWLTLHNPRKGAALLIAEGVSLLIANLMFLQNELSTRCLLVVALSLPPLLIGRMILTQESHNGARFV